MAERPAVLNDAEARVRSPQPEVVVFVPFESFVEAANRIDHLAAEHRHDAHCVLVLDEVEQRKTPQAAALDRPERPSVEISAG